MRTIQVIALLAVYSTFVAAQVNIPYVWESPEPEAPPEVIVVDLDTALEKHYMDLEKARESVRLAIEEYIRQQQHIQDEIIRTHGRQLERMTEDEEEEDEDSHLIKKSNRDAWQDYWTAETNIERYVARARINQTEEFMRREDERHDRREKALEQDILVTHNATIQNAERLVDTKI